MGSFLGLTIRSYCYKGELRKPIMAFPNFEHKYLEASLVSPEDFWNYREKRGELSTFTIPEGVIFCYSKTLVEHVLQTYETTAIEEFPGEMYLLYETQDQIALIGNFGFGAPVATAILEDLVSFGVKKFISMGTAGSLQKGITAGDVVVCERALRDEGTSYHYVQPSKYAYASIQMTERIAKSLDNLGATYIMGTSWTTDAPYRETATEVKHYQNEGVVTVEMEASALFAVAAFRNVEMGAVLTISDSIAELVWNPQFHKKEIQKKLQLLFRAAVNALLQR